MDVFADADTVVGTGEGLVEQRIWNKKGRLVASCYQEVSPLIYLINIHRAKC